MTELPAGCVPNGGNSLTKQKIKLLTGFGSYSRALYSTMFLCSKQIFDGGFLSVSGGYFVQTVQFVMLIFTWKSLGKSSTPSNGLSIDQLMTYTLMATIFHQELNIISPVTSFLWEGSVIGRFLRPMPVEISFFAETIGTWWIPNFIFFGLPLWLLSSFFGISPWPAGTMSGFFSVFSLILAASLDFSIDLLFASLAVREAVYSLLPLGSIVSGPLTIYTGTSENQWKVLGLQIFWNLILWTAASHVFKKSKERMKLYSGSSLAFYYYYFIF